MFKITKNTVLKVDGRLVCVVEDDTGYRQAFYQSTGHNGGADQGEWCPFFGLSFSIADSHGIWFIKQRGQKTALPGSVNEAMVSWLTDQTLPEPVAVFEFYLWRFGAAERRLSNLRNLMRVNHCLDQLGARSCEIDRRFNAQDYRRVRITLKEDWL